MATIRAILTWVVVGTVVLVPIFVAAMSPLLAWRQPIYIAAGFAGVVGMALIFFQPLLAGGYLPGLAGRRGRRVHRWTGTALVAAVIFHVAGLWLTSPPDVVDALLFVSPTPFSVWGVLAMWALFGAAALAALRWRLRARLSLWRFGHTALVAVVVLGSVIHAMLIEGTMGTASKAVFCLLVLAVTLKTLIDLRSWSFLARLRA